MPKLNNKEKYKTLSY